MKRGALAAVPIELTLAAVGAVPRACQSAGFAFEKETAPRSLDGGTSW